MNTASSCAPSGSESYMYTAKTERTTSEFLDIFSVAFGIRHEIMKYTWNISWSKGFDGNPLDIKDLQLDTAKCLLPQSLHWLIRWTVPGKPLGNHHLPSFVWLTTYYSVSAFHALLSYLHEDFWIFFLTFPFPKHKPSFSNLQNLDIMIKCDLLWKKGH